MDDCIFCKIIAGELPCAKVYEDEHTLAFLDIHPVRPGHTLVVPKTHCQDFLDCDPAVFRDIMPVTQKVARAVVKATGAEGFNLGVNNGRAAGQVIFHLHLHVIPRNIGDGLRLWPNQDYQEGKMQEIAGRIKKAFES